MSSIWESTSSVAVPQTGILVQPKKSNFGWIFLIGLAIIASVILGIVLYESKKKKDEEAAAASSSASGGGALLGGSPTMSAANAAAAAFTGTSTTPIYPPQARSASSLINPGIPQQDPGRPGTDAAWWHDVERYDLISQTAVSPWGGFWPASPTIEGRSRGQFYKGYGSFSSGPYNSGFLTYPSNFIPLSTTQISVTDLHPFCSKQR